MNSDADIVIYDPNKTGRIHAAVNHSVCDYDPYEGMETVGGVDAVLLNGVPAVENGEPLGGPGGRFVPRGPSQFWR